MLIRCEKKFEIGISQNDLSIRVQSVRLEFLLPPKTNSFPFRFRENWKIYTHPSLLIQCVKKIPV